MPTLALKDNPPSRFPEASILESTQIWSIAKVRARQEKALAFDLMAEGIGYYLPLFSKSFKRPDTGKKRTSILPIFPSYLPFECESVPPWLFRSERVAAIIEVKAQNRFREQLHAIYQCRECTVGLADIPQREFTIGQQVRVLAGPCAGIVGNLVKRINENFLVINVEGLGFAGIRVNAEFLEPV